MLTTNAASMQESLFLERMVALRLARAISRSAHALEPANDAMNGQPAAICGAGVEPREPTMLFHAILSRL